MNLIYLYCYLDPSEAPHGFVAEMLNSTTYFLSWTPPPPSTHNGVLNGYQVTCLSQESDIVRMDISGTSFTSDEFLPHSHYTCSVCAFTSVGCGPVDITYLSTYPDCKLVHINLTSSAHIVGTPNIV